MRTKQTMSNGGPCIVIKLTSAVNARQYCKAHTVIPVSRGLSLKYICTKAGRGDQNQSVRLCIRK